MISRMDVPDLNYISTYRIIGIIVAFIIFASVISYSKDLFIIDTTWFKNMLINQQTSVHKNEDVARVGPSSIPVSSDSNIASDQQTWCFVGEDNVGKWCVQVSSPNMCPPERSFGSKNRCETNKSI